MLKSTNYWSNTLKKIKIKAKTYGVHISEDPRVNTSILPTLIYRFNQIPIKIMGFFVDIDIIAKFIWKNKGTRIASPILKKRNKVGGICLSNFKI